MALGTKLSNMPASKLEAALGQDEVTRALDTDRKAKKAVSENKKSSAKEPILRRMADVQPEEVGWLWKPYIPIGKITVLEGDPGQGKTWLALQLAAIVSNGWPFPDCETGIPEEKAVIEPRNVIYMSAEDGLADTLRPRLDKARADVERVFTITGKALEDGTKESITLADIDTLRTALSIIRPTLVTIDPLQAYLGNSVDMHRANEVRPVLSKLGELAEEYKTAVVCIRHLGKSNKDRAVYRGLGSIDFAAAARSMLLAGKDPENPEKRIIAHVKSSLAPDGPSIGYELREGGFYWTGITEATAQTILAPEKSNEERTLKDEAKDFLLDVLSDGPVLSKNIKSEARAAGISDRTLERAKSDLKVRHFKGVKKWYWALPTKSGGEHGEHGEHIEKSRLNNNNTVGEHGGEHGEHEIQVRQPNDQVRQVANMDKPSNDEMFANFAKSANVCDEDKQKDTEKLFKIKGGDFNLRDF